MILGYGKEVVKMVASGIHGVMKNRSTNNKK